MKHIIYLSLGSNLGDRVNYIQVALQKIQLRTVLEKVSFLYETDPVGFLYQPAFLNCACRCSTDLNPIELLNFFEQVMHDMGRIRGAPLGPRIIDIDILMYDDIIFSSDRLTIPHPRMHERTFVMEPLCDIDPNVMHPVLKKNMQELLLDLPMSGLQRVTPIGNQLLRWGTKTYVMGIVNATPDSFSGDGLIGKSEAEIVNHVQSLIQGGADILDIGSMSSRPGHTLIPEGEEIERLIPVITLIRKHFTIPISVDTFRGSVAQAAVDAGADLINSIWGCEYDPELLSVIKEKNIPMVLTENRMVTDYFQTDVTIKSMIQQALAKGTYPWNIIIDPGIGFVKKADDNFELIKNIPKIKELGFPILVGASRKKFIRTLVDKDTNEDLVLANVVVHNHLVQQGADMVRVHDVGAVVEGLAISATLDT